MRGEGGGGFGRRIGRGTNQKKKNRKREKYLRPRLPPDLVPVPQPSDPAPSSLDFPNLCTKTLFTNSNNVKKKKTKEFPLAEKETAHTHTHTHQNQIACSRAEPTPPAQQVSTHNFFFFVFSPNYPQASPQSLSPTR